MPPDGTPCLLDSSVLINVLKLDRADLLELHPRYRFLVTPDVQVEIGEQHDDQLPRFNQVFNSGLLERTRLEDPREVMAFVELTRARLGSGESAAVAAAVVRRFPVAIDDIAAQRKSKRAHPAISIVTTADLIHDHVVAGLLTVRAADDIKGYLEAKLHFRMPFQSFAEWSHGVAPRETQATTSR